MRRSLLAVVSFAALAIAFATLTSRPSLAQPDPKAEPAAAAGEGGPRVGDACVVYLRGDASGAAFHDRVPDLGNLITVRGHLTGVDGAWLILKGEDGKRLWVPRASVMVVEAEG